MANGNTNIRRQVNENETKKNIPHKESHALRLLRQVIKKAKNFEIRKLCRKLKLAVEQENGKNAPSDGKGPHRVKLLSSEKLNSQLIAIKALELENCLLHACMKLGLTPGGEPLVIDSKESVQPKEPVPDGSTPDVENREKLPILGWAEQRLLGATCVREAIEKLKNAGLKKSTNPDKEKPEKKGKKGQMENEEGKKSGSSESTPAGKDLMKANNPKNASISVGQEMNILEGLPEYLDLGEVRKETVGEVVEKDDDFFASDSSEGEDIPVGPSRNDDSDFSGSERSFSDVESEELEEQLKPKGNVVQGPKQKKSKAKKKPKNRLGQRERKRLGELKEREKNARKANAHGGGSGGRRDFSNRSGLPRTVVPKPAGSEKKRKFGGQGVGALKAARNETPEKLHPSWAAKAAEKKQLALPGTGKKIKFDDDE